MVRISRGESVFILTGAGISAESGIPTFRDAGGLWRNHRFEDVASPAAWRRDPQLVWDFYSMRRRVAAAAKPNTGHMAIGELAEALGEGLFLCTQNVDDLHEQGGAQNVVHMHGELFKTRCERCDRAPFVDTKTYEAPREIPRCACGAKLRPHICWFGEMPFYLDEIREALVNCGTFVAIGTSGVVEPAASFVSYARQHARTIYVGAEEPANRLAFHECYVGKAGDVVPGLFELAQ